MELGLFRYPGQRSFSGASKADVDGKHTRLLLAEFGHHLIAPIPSPATTCVRCEVKLNTRPFSLRIDWLPCP